MEMMADEKYQTSLNWALVRIEVLEKREAALREALEKACGYMTNAAIDLQTGAPKRTALNTIEGGLKMVRAALDQGTPS